MCTRPKIMYYSRIVFLLVTCYKAAGPVYTWRTLNDVKFNTNKTQYSSSKIFWQCNRGTDPELY